MQKMGLSVTHSDNKINIKHNNRSFEEKEWGHTTNSHINRELTQYNTSFIQQDIKEAYQEAFGEPLEEYNAKQKRQDRKIDDYYEYIKGLNDSHKKKGKSNATTKYNLQDEIILTIGNKETWDELHHRTLTSINDKQEAEKVFIEYKKKLADEIFKNFLEEFQAKHKHLHVFNAVAHYDEAGAPHMHLTFFGKAEGMKKGLRLQPRTTRAIAQDLDGDFYQKMLESDQKKYDLAKENRERKKQGLEALQGDRKGDMSAGMNVYTQFLTETKQILIDKAREVGFEYEAVGKHNWGDMDHFKEAMAQKKEAFDKEINEYKQEKQGEIKRLDEEISNKRTQAQEAEKTAKQAKEDAEKAVQEKAQAEQEARQAVEKRDEASREERIAKQNAEIAQKNAEKFKADLERVKAENEAKKAELNERKEELSEISEKIADQTLELEEAKEKQAQELAQQRKELEAQKETLKKQVEENIAKINEQRQEIGRNENRLAQYNEEYRFVTKRDNALTRLEQGLRKMDEPIDYEKEVGVSKIFPGNVTMREKIYKKMREKATFFDTFSDLRDTLVSAIMESPIVKRLQEQVIYWKNKFFSLEKSYNKMKEDLEEDIYDLKGDINLLNRELEDHRLFEHQFRKYLKDYEQEQVFEKIRTREEKDIKENGIEKAREPIDDFSYER